MTVVGSGAYMVTDANDAPPFTGRKEELALLARQVQSGSLPPVLYLHGPPGIGKTALLRELHERHGDRSWLWRDATRLDDADWPASDVVVVDSLHPHLTGRVRDRLTRLVLAGSRVLIGARRPPDASWHDGTWDTLVVPVGLKALDDGAAWRLLARLGVGRDRAERLVAWSAGEPLALILAAQSDAHDVEVSGDTSLAARLERHLLALDRRLAFGRFSANPMEVLEAAAVASAVDGDVLAAALSGIDADEALSWLGGLSVASSHGTGLALCPRLRWATQTRLQGERPTRLRELRRRVADHAARRSARGERRYLLELAEVVDDRHLGWGIGSEVGARFRVDTVKGGDVEAVGRFLEGRPNRWQSVRRWLEDAPGHVQVMRDEGGGLAGVSVSLSVGDAPEWAADDSLAGPWLEYARSHHAPDEAALLRDSLILAAGADRSEVATVGNAGLGTGRGFTARWLYALIEPEDADKARFVKAMGYERFQPLDGVDPEFTLHCYRVDLGPGGLVATTHALVYRHLGLDAPPQRLTAITRADVVEALQGFHQPTTLLANPLGREAKGEERIASVRDRIQEAMDAAFDDDPLDSLRKAAVAGAYLDSDGSHTATARKLHLSRATYFRRLAEGVEKVVAYLTGG